MDRGDFENLASVSASLWAQRDLGRSPCEDAVAATALLHADSEAAAERVAAALLARSKISDAPRHRDLNHPFFRLPVRERFLLGGLHRAHWTYARMARLLQISVSEVETLAWTTRQLLASQSPKPQPPERISEQRPASRHHCPEYDAERPWTQRLLDDELGLREKQFLQSHVMVCGVCRAQLHRARDIFFSVDALCPQPSSVDTELADDLQEIWNLEVRRIRPSERTLSQSLRIFFVRREVLIALGLWALATAAAIIARG